MDARPSDAFLELFRREASAHAGRLPFDAFMRLALFDPALGYYTAARTRVGRARGTDFYTSSSIGAGLFGELVAAACAKLLRDKGLDPAAHTFVEIGAESEQGILGGVAHPFAGIRILRVGTPLSISGPCVVFSNELLDAQPCRHFRRSSDAWLELGVEARDGILVECEQGLVSEKWLPGTAPEGYVFDAPREASELTTRLTAQPWTGLFLAFDYGRSFNSLAEEFPSGTLRAYHQHKQIRDLLARPGEQDLTCDICWDWIGEALVAGGCQAPTLQSQEAFLVHQAGDFIAATLAREGAGFSARKQSLLQLMHPAHMGQRFQALYAWK